MQWDYQAVRFRSFDRKYLAGAIVAYVGLLLYMGCWMVEWAKRARRHGPVLLDGRWQKRLEGEESPKRQSWRNFMRRYTRALKRKVRRALERLRWMGLRGRVWLRKASGACRAAGRAVAAVRMGGRLEPTREAEEEYRGTGGKPGVGKAIWIGGRRWPGSRVKTRGAYPGGLCWPPQGCRRRGLRSRLLR